MNGACQITGRLLRTGITKFAVYLGKIFEIQDTVTTSVREFVAVDLLLVTLVKAFHNSLATARQHTFNLVRIWNMADGHGVLAVVRCGCMGANGRRRVCVPPKVGWMCERKATLIKHDIILEREQEER